MVTLLLPFPPMLVHLFELANLSIALLLPLLDPDWNFHLPIPMVMVIPFLVSN